MGFTPTTGSGSSGSISGSTDVALNSTSNNQLIGYDSAAGKWTNRSPNITAIVGLQTALDSKYVKLGIGIPETDLDAAVQDKLNTSGVADDSITAAKIAESLANTIMLNVYRTAASSPNWVTNAASVISPATLHAQGFGVAFWCEVGYEPAIGTGNGEVKEGRDAVYQINSEI